VAAHDDSKSTAGEDYAARLVSLEGAWWKRMLDVQRPYRWNLRRHHLGRVLDVGCGIGRNLVGLDPSSVGVDHNARSIEVARSRGFTAFTTDEFFVEKSRHLAAFDSILCAHVVEHMEPDTARAVVGSYLPFLKPGGRVMLICPQELGYTTDETHVCFVDERGLAELAVSLGLAVLRSYSFPLPRLAGRVFAYNETCVLASKPAAA
jgi:2-polyprenyl-3-methyl-5-hydroxy-6-metoxy-1,4-benzoquinol methylase